MFDVASSSSSAQKRELQVKAFGDKEWRKWREESDTPSFTHHLTTTQT
jgi:hypothetical protein